MSLRLWTVVRMRGRGGVVGLLVEGGVECQMQAILRLDITRYPVSRNTVIPETKAHARQIENMPKKSIQPGVLFSMVSAAVESTPPGDSRR